MSTPDLTKRNYPARLFERTSPATFYISSIHLFAVAGSFLLLLSGCSSVGGEVQAGRNALQTNRPEAAVAYLASAAEVDPTYRIPFEFPRVCWAILAALTWKPEDRQKLAELWSKH
jgi:hypothetical protein